MIKELRIGNWIQLYNFSDVTPYSYRQIAGVLIDGTFYISDDTINGYWRLKEDERGYVSIKPIHLTHEILDKAGFKKGMSNDDYSLDTECIFYFDENLKCYIETSSFRREELSIKHLHQLQNLYFALTGEDLNIQL